MTSESRFFPIIASMLCASLFLSSCTSLSSEPSKKTHAKAVTKPVIHQDATAYVSNLAIAHTALAFTSATIDDVADNVTIINEYEAQKNHKAEKLTLAVLDFKPKGSETVQQAMAPFNLDKSDFGHVQAMLEKLNGASVILQDTKVVTVSVQPDKARMLPKESKDIVAALDEQQALLLAKSGHLNSADEIKANLALIDFYTRNHFQDAAYLTVDNVKRKLGQEASNKSLDNVTLQNFSNELEMRESTLKQPLPYKF